MAQHALTLKRLVRRPIPEETPIVRRYAKALAQGRYRNAADAAAPCLHSLRRAGLGRGLDEGKVAASLRHLSLSWGRRLKYTRWSAAECRIVDRFARRLAAGRYACANAAVGDCRKALTQAGLRDHLGERTIGNKLRHRSRLLGRRSVFLHWLPRQNRIAARFARAVVKGRYPHATAAVADCAAAMKAGGEPVRYSRQAVAAKLWRLARDLGLEPRAARWTGPEMAVARKWARKYYLYKTGQARMGLCTIAGMMQAELSRVGYVRTFYACKGAMVNSYRRGWFH